MPRPTLPPASSGIARANPRSVTDSRAAAAPRTEPVLTKQAQPAAAAKPAPSVPAPPAPAVDSFVQGAGPAPQAPAAGVANAVEGPGLSVPKLKEELKVLFSIIDNRYGPLKAKATGIGLNWEAVKTKYLGEVDNVRDISDYYFLISRLLAEFNDAHVSITLPTNLTYKLPLQMASAGGKIVVNHVQPEQFPPGARRPQLGDELVAVNGVPAADFQKSNPHFNKFGNDVTNRAMFARMLGSIEEHRGIQLSKFPKQVTLTFRAGEGQPTYDCTLEYKASGVGMIGKPVHRPPGGPAERIEEEVSSLFGDAEVDPEQVDQVASLVSLVHSIHELFNLETALPLANPEPTKSGEGTPISMGHKKPLFKLPPDFKEIVPPKSAQELLNNESFFAGTFSHNGKRVGLLRIPSYSPKNVSSVPLGIRYYLNRLEKESDVLIIDQLNNPGGAVTFSDLFIKGLVGKFDPNHHMRFAVNPSQHFLRGFAELLDQVKSNQGNIVPPERQKEFSEKLTADYSRVESAFLNGEHLSEPVALATYSEIAELAAEKMIETFKEPLAPVAEEISKPQVYTKPVYFLINELDFSGGDATPALFQDYGRGQVIGVNTAGAGGSVEQFSHRSVTELNFRLTASLMIRKGGKLVENIGVKPDVEFAATQDDYRNNFANFLPRLLQKLEL